MFENYRTFKYELAGRPLVIETGKIAQLSNGSCLVRYGETVILANATASAAPRDGIDFLPLSVDYEERLYAVGLRKSDTRQPCYRQTDSSSVPEGPQKRRCSLAHGHVGRP